MSKNKIKVNNLVNRNNLVYFLFFILVVLLIIGNYLGYFNYVSIDIPIVTYHDISIGESNGSMQITKERFEEDMNYLKNNNYTPILVQDFIDISKGIIESPQKPIMITFDDGYISNYELAFPILKETSMKAIISVIAMNIRDDMGNGFDIFMSWEQCREMYESGLVDIENHTYNLHNPETGGLIIPDGVNGIGRIKDEHRYDYYDRVYGDLELCNKLIEENVGNKVKYFAHPYGYTEYLAFKIFKELDIELAVVSDMGVANTSNNKLKLKRLGITMEETLEEVLNNYNFY